MGGPCDHGPPMVPLRSHGGLAQLVEHPPPKWVAVGSSPATPVKEGDPDWIAFFVFVNRFRISTVVFDVGNLPKRRK